MRPRLAPDIRRCLICGDRLLEEGAGLGSRGVDFPLGNGEAVWARPDVAWFDPWNDRRADPRPTEPEWNSPRPDGTEAAPTSDTR